MAESNEAPASAEDNGSWTPVIYFGLLILAAIVFTVYVLAWDGGAHT